MSQIEELQSRITAAMERIGTGVETLSERKARVEPDPAVQEQLDEERVVTAQLQERLARIKARHEEQLEQMGKDLTAQTDAMARLDMDLQRLRQANDKLRESNAALRAANAEGLADADLINSAMLAELDALRASQAADAAERIGVLSRLDALLAVDDSAATADDEEDA